jgi:multicomponent Na+:H+ antiporter subunit G
VADLIAGALVILGSAFVMLAGLGTLRLPDLYSRMHAATKAPTLGFLLIASGALVVADAGRGKLALAVAIIFVTAPVAAHLVGRSAYRARGVDARLDAEDDLGRTLDERGGHP